MSARTLAVYIRTIILTYIAEIAYILRLRYAFDRVYYEINKQAATLGIEAGED